MNKQLLAWSAMACLLVACGDDDDASQIDNITASGSGGGGSGAGGSKASAGAGGSAGSRSSSSNGGAGGAAGSEPAMSAAAGSGGASGSKSEPDEAGKGGSGAGGAGGAGGSKSEPSAAGKGGTGGTPAPEAGSGGTPNPPEPPSDGPVVTAIWVRGEDVNHNYLLVSKDPPSGMIDLKSARELPDGTFTSYENALYFLNWETSGIDRYEVDADMKLQKTGSLSFLNYGITNPFSWHTVFFSETKAYYIDPDEARIIVWNPKEMTIDAELDAPALAKTGFSLQLGGANRVDDTWIISGLWANEELTDIDHQATALIVKDDAAAPARVVEDPRCPGTRSSFVDDKGDVYLLGDGYGGYLAIGLGVDLPKPCMLRIKRGEQSIDASYKFDIAEVTKSRAMQGLWHLTQRKLVVQSWPEALDPKTVIMDSEDYWLAPVLQWKLVDIDANQAENITGISDSPPYQLSDFEVDGVNYLLKHDETDTAAGRSALYALDANGAAKMTAETSGDFWFLRRLTKK